MKNLTIEQKAQRYDGAKRTNELNYVSNKDSLQHKTAEHIFPELKESKESEDEKIRKHLITLFKDEYGENSSARFAGIKVKDIIAWFEEQSDKDKLIKELGEYKVKYTQEVLNGYLNISNKDSERLRKTTIDFLKEFADKGYENAIECIDWLEKQGESELSEDLGEYIVELSKQFPEVSFAKLSRIAVRVKNWLEKQGEQKPTDNAEPKFKVGAWITIDKPCQIISINDNGNYIVQYCDDKKTHELSKNFCESHFHIWSIKDAKDGDVLINTSAKYPFIFKQLKPSDIKTDIKNPLTVLGHCGIGGAGFTKSEGWGDTANCTYYPAAKEQRDLLFRKMYEAGYTFDFEKKESKKIESKFKVGDWIVNNITKEIFKITELIDFGYESIDENGKTHTLFIDENDYHLWAIQDAKDGDVLAHGEQLFLFKRMNTSNSFYAHCNYHFIGYDSLSVYDCSYSIDNIYPATKEQSELLFRKIKESGYKWDSEKKELKRIVTPIFHIGDRVRYKGHACDGVITEITDTDYICGNAKLPISTQDKLELVGQKSAWSEEDEKNYDISLKILCASNKSEKLINNLYDWFKSLKDRVQPHNTWKPSKEQMGVIEAVINNRSFQRRYLDSLYQDLLKLMEK